MVHKGANFITSLCLQIALEAKFEGWGGAQNTVLSRKSSYHCIFEKLNFSAKQFWGGAQRLWGEGRTGYVEPIFVFFAISPLVLALEI